MIKRLMLLGVAFLIMVSSASATPLQQGMFQYKWGESAANHIYLTEMGTKDEVVYYSHLGEIYMVGDAVIDKEIYGFYKDQLFGVYFNIESLDVYDKVLAHLKKKYGLPSSKLSEDDTHVLKWKKGDVAIKLKTDNAEQKMKLAFYYRPISSKLNAQQWEDLDTDTFNFVPINADKKPEKLILFEF